MSRTLHARAAGLALVAVLAAGAAAQTIDTVSSSDDGTVDETVSATVGSVLTIDGSGFGTAKPKVFLTDGEGKKYVLKVTAFADGQLTAEIKKAVLGDLTLNVQPKGAAEPVTFEFVTIEAPVIDQLLDATLAMQIEEIGPNEEFVLSGAFFGSKKGKIFIGGKKAKVLEWLADEIHLLMPKTLANGAWDILLDNKIDVDDAHGITMTGNDNVKVGKLSLTVTITGGEGAGATTIKYKYKNSADDVDDGYLAFGGATGEFPIIVTGLVFPFDTATDTVPADIVSDENAGMTISFSVALKGPSKFVPGEFASWLVLPGAEGFTVNMKTSGGGQAGGTFVADLPLITPANGASAMFGNGPVHIEGTFVCEELD